MMKQIIVCLTVLFAVAFASGQVGSFQCDACNYIVSTVEGWVEEEKTIDEIDTLLDKLCDTLGNKYTGVCDNIMNVTVADLVEFIKEYESPAKVCQEINICTPSAPKSVLECDGCHYIVETVEGWLENKKSIDEIDTLLDKLCALLGNQYTGICDKIMNVTVEELVGFIEQYEQPAKVCVQIGMCSSMKPKANIFECDSCHYIVGAIEGWLAEEHTEEEIDDKLDKLCTVLGNKYTGICDKIMNVTVHDIIEFLEKYESPEKVCKEIGMCSSVSSPKANVFECDACNYIVGAIEGWLDDEHTEEEIDAKLDKLCTLLGNKYTGVCDKIMNVTVHDIIQFLDQYEQPKKVCQEIGLCTKASKPKQKAQGVECAACTVIIDKVEEWIAEEKTEDEIIQLLDQLCQTISSTVCETIVNNDLSEVIQWLEQQEDPNTVCTQLGMCGN